MRGIVLPADVVSASDRARRVDLWLIGAVAGLIYFALRSTTDFIWNDSVGLYALPGPPHAASLVELLGSLSTLIHLLGTVSGGNYRPLAIYLAQTSTMFDFHIWLAAIACIVGGSAAAMFALATRLLAGRLWALIATILFICSPAFLTGSWVVLAGQQPLVALIMCMGVLFYLRQMERHGWRRLLEIAGLAFTLLIGPWYREFLGVIAALIIAEELWVCRRPTWVMGLAALGFVHGLFPMLLPKLLINPAVPLIPITRLGDVGTQLGSAEPAAGGLMAHIGESIRQLRWGVSSFFVALFPPTLVVLAFFGFCFKSAQGALGAILELGRGGFRNPGGPLWKLAGSRFVVGSFCLGGVILVSSILIKRGHLPWHVVDAWIAAAFILYGWALSSLLGLWMAATLLPFYKVFTEIVHLAYPMVPGSIIVAAGLRECWRAARLLEGTSGKLLTRAFAGIVALLLVDQALNVYGVWYVVQQCNSGMQTVAAALKREIPRGSVVLSNVMHLYDIDRYAGHWVQAYFTMRGGVGGPFADTPDTVSQLLQAHPDSVYLLDADQPYEPGQYMYHSHPLVRAHAVDWIDLGSVHETKAFYPYVDPLDFFVRRPFVPFLGSPDLVQDFYHGRAMDRRPFLREVYVNYHLYRVVGTAVRSW